MTVRADRGDGFVLLQPDTVRRDEVSPECHPVIVGLESLRAMKRAADDFGQNKADVHDVFCDNAWRLLGIPPSP